MLQNRPGGKNPEIDFSGGLQDAWAASCAAICCDAVTLARLAQVPISIFAAAPAALATDGDDVDAFTAMSTTSPAAVETASATCDGGADGFIEPRRLGGLDSSGM